MSDRRLLDAMLIGAALHGWPLIASGPCTGSCAPPTTTALQAPPCPADCTTKAAPGIPRPVNEMTPAAVATKGPEPTSAPSSEATSLAVIASAIVGGVLSAIGLLGLIVQWFQVSAGNTVPPPGPQSAAPLTRRPRPQPIQYRSHWGSFGGDGGGWSLSPALAKLAVALSLVVVGAWLLAASLKTIDLAHPPKGTDAATPAATASAASKP